MMVAGGQEDRMLCALLLLPSSLSPLDLGCSWARCEPVAVLSVHVPEQELILAPRWPGSLVAEPWQSLSSQRRGHCSPRAASVADAALLTNPGA